jgi:RHS repeat-associated protein
MGLPGRKFSATTGYRYGFNGKENDNEVKGEGDQQDYGMRVYDPRLGRFLSVDPLTKKFPWLTSYQYASNSPIWAIDIDGLESDKQTDPASQPSHPIQTIEDGYGDYIKRTYSMNLTNSKMTAKQIFEDVSTKFAKYTVGVSYFERIKGKDNAKVGDEWAITGGPSYRVAKLSDYKQRYPNNTLAETYKNQVDEEAGTIHWGEISTGVTVKSISNYENAYWKTNSFTFSTWEGHVEAGEITFSVTQFGKDGENAFITFNITSNSRSSNFITDKAYKYLGGKKFQTEHWKTFLENLKKATGANTTEPKLTTETSETPIKEKETPVFKPKR